MTFNGTLATITNAGSQNYQVKIDQNGGGDSAILFEAGTPTNWIHGIDNSDGDKYKISNAAVLGTSDYITLGASTITFNQTVAGFSMGGALDMGGNNIDSAAIITADTINAGEKNFDIPHPSKKGWRLRYSVLEGPERGVYVRGTVTGEGIIELPDYWKDLVYEDSITVQLTSIGSSCVHHVINVDSSQIAIGCGCGDVNAFYTVFAERKAKEPVWVEYQIVQ